MRLCPPCSKPSRAAAAAGNITPWNRTDQFTAGGFQPGHFTPDAMDATIQPLVDAWVTGVGRTVEALGGTAGSYGFDLGVDKDPNGQAANRLGIRANVNGRQVYNYWSGNDALGRDDATLQAAMELESKRALLAALQASDLPAQIANVFDNLAANSATAAQIDNLMLFGSAMKSIIDSISGDVLADATQQWNDLNKTSTQRLSDMGAEVIRLANATDGSTESMQALAGATSTFRNAVQQVLVAIRQVAQQAEQMQASLVEGILTSQMTPGQRFNYFIGAANTAALGLSTASSPEDVQAIAAQVYAAIDSAFGALPDDLRGTYTQPLLDFLSEFGAGVNEALTNIQGDTLDQTTSPFAAAEQALNAAGDKFTGAASKTESAAQVLSNAADRISDAVDSFVGSLPIPVSVRLTGTELTG
jgi:methyl-accepting chemotaxis protein